MGKLDNVMGVLKEAFHETGKKTTSVVEISKLKISAVKINGEIDELYRKLGSLVYDMKKIDADNPIVIDSCIEEIDTLKQKLNYVDQKIAENKNVVICHICGSTNVADSIFCSKCGSEVKNKAKENTDQAQSMSEDTFETDTAQSFTFSNANEYEKAVQSKDATPHVVQNTSKEV